MKCPYCSNEIPAGAANCPSCGAAAPQQQQAPQPQVVIQQQVVPQTTFFIESRTARIVLHILACVCYLISFLDIISEDGTEWLYLVFAIIGGAMTGIALRKKKIN